MGQLTEIATWTPRPFVTLLPSRPSSPRSVIQTKLSLSGSFTKSTQNTPLSIKRNSPVSLSRQPLLANILLYGNDNVVLLDATFGTNHMKMPLYTGLVMDDFGNGLPGFMILCQGVSEDDITTWLQALLKKLRLELHDWMCLCVMVDDAIAEINAIKYALWSNLYVGCMILNVCATFAASSAAPACSYASATSAFCCLGMWYATCLLLLHFLSLYFQPLHFLPLHFLPLPLP